MLTVTLPARMRALSVSSGVPVAPAAGLAGLSDQLPAVDQLPLEKELRQTRVAARAGPAGAPPRAAVVANMRIVKRPRRPCTRARRIDVPCPPKWCGDARFGAALSG